MFYCWNPFLILLSIKNSNIVFYILQIVITFIILRKNSDQPQPITTATKTRRRPKVDHKVGQIRKRGWLLQKPKGASKRQSRTKNLKISWLVRYRETIQLQIRNAFSLRRTQLVIHLVLITITQYYTTTTIDIYKYSCKIETQLYLNIIKRLKQFDRRSFIKEPYTTESSKTTQNICTTGNNVYFQAPQHARRLRLRTRERSGQSVKGNVGNKVVILCTKKICDFLIAITTYLSF